MESTSAVDFARIQEAKRSDEVSKKPTSSVHFARIQEAKRSDEVSKEPISAVDFAQIQEAWRFDQLPKDSHTLWTLIFGDGRFHLFMYNKLAKSFKWLKSQFVVNYSRITSVKEPIPPEIAIDVDFNFY